MHLYSIMPLDVEHVEEICLDVKNQYEQGVCDCALFMMKLVPEGTPPIDKAKLECEKYDLFRDRLKKLGLECGILVQCSIGHGYKLDQMFPFTQSVGLNDGQKKNVVCPYDQDFRKFMYEQFQTLAKHRPKVIMLDDDFRLVARAARGCACELHLKEFNKLTGEVVEGAEQLYKMLTTKSDKQEEYVSAFLKTQSQSLIDCAKAMREGIDSVDPTILGIYCCCGKFAENAGEIGQIFAGKNNPVVVRMGNGFYCRESAKTLSSVGIRFAQQKEFIKDQVDYMLAESDTCPQNRYSTSANSVHTHMIMSILEGAIGAKHWITRLTTHEPESGVAYRKTLAKYRKMYDALINIYPKIKWQGCRIPIIKQREYGFIRPLVEESGWAVRVLERMGFPLFYSSDPEGACFVDENCAPSLTDQEILDILKGTAILSGGAVENFISRGYGEYLGVDIKEWTGPNQSRERFIDINKTCAIQLNGKQLIPNSDKTKTLSYVEHIKNGTENIPLFPAVTSYENSLGGTIVCYSGTPNARFVYFEAFSMLNQSRKTQFENILKSTGNLPAYYKGDAEVYVKSGVLKDGGQIVALTNLSYDILEDFKLGGLETATSVKMLTPDGDFVDCDFSILNNTLSINSVLYPLQPLILKIL